MVNKTNAKSSEPALAPGQLWKLGHIYIQILQLGQQLLQYKMLNEPDEPGVRPQMSGIDTMWGYLSSRHARLVKSHA